MFGCKKAKVTNLRDNARLAVATRIDDNGQSFITEPVLREGYRYDRYAEFLEARQIFQQYRAADIRQVIK